MEQASPQLEHGFTRIANELLEAITVYPFNATELKIVLCLIRRTYGWKKKMEIISYGTIAKDINADIRYVKRLIRHLAEGRVVFKQKLGRQNLMGLNKNYRLWRLWKTQNSGGELATVAVVNQPPGQWPPNPGK